ncbi:MAG TPA: hypothetical protein VLD37_05410 [Candidatus Bilamarchaeum sp.]|nr:hypothetical protein [Candidatus Bilamarchaeum sp.]
MYMKKPATQKTTVGEFRRLGADLLNRGFVEEPAKAEGGVMHDMMRVGAFTREFSNFTITVGASQEAADVIQMREQNRGRDGMGASLWAKCATPANRSVGELARMFARKSHYVSDASRSGGIYHADLVPFPDPSVLIDSCLKLGDAVARIKGDMEFASGIDAKEVHDVMVAAKGQVGGDNSYAAYLANYMVPLLDSLRKKMDYEFARIMNDAGVHQALAQVADKE